MVAALWNSTPTSETNFLNNFLGERKLYLNQQTPLSGGIVLLGKWSPFILRGKTEGWKGDVPRHSDNPASHLEVSIGIIETKVHWVEKIFWGRFLFL